MHVKKDFVPAAFSHLLEKFFNSLIGVFFSVPGTFSSKVSVGINLNDVVIVRSVAVRAGLRLLRGEGRSNADG
jgi:hypothetical protein